MRARKSASRCSGATSRSNSSFGLTLATTRLARRRSRRLRARRRWRARARRRTRATAAPVRSVDAARRALARHRLRDRAHAAERVAPLAALAVDLAEHVVQQHVGRARRVRAREVADDGVEAERGLDRRRLEPAIEHVAGALGEQVEHVAPPGERRAREIAARLFHASSIATKSRRPPPRTLGGVWRSRSRAARRRRGRASRSTRAAARRRAASTVATSACVAARPPPTLRYAPSRQAAGNWRAAARRSPGRGCARCRSRITWGSSRLTV